MKLRFWSAEVALCGGGALYRDGKTSREPHPGRKERGVSHLETTESGSSETLECQVSCEGAGLMPSRALGMRVSGSWQDIG